MARIDTLSNFLTDVATAIKTKKGDNTPIQASSFDTEIANLPSGDDIDEYIDLQLQSKNLVNYYNWPKMVRKLPPMIPLSQDITNLKFFFYGFEGEELDVSAWDTSNVTDMNRMFYNCENLITLDLSNFNTSNVTDMFSMFKLCKNLISIDISSFDTSNITNMIAMFGGCSSLIKVIINKTTILEMKNPDIFTETPIQSGTGYVYVPDNMVDTYKSATNWSTYASQIKPISELEGYNNA